MQHTLQVFKLFDRICVVKLDIKLTPMAWDVSKTNNNSKNVILVFV